ncbi:MAG: chromosome segregation protein SMC [Bacteroidetes bacterium]|nr:MAG: chromosome segregation protein SMC [Bacteroidota bacterium]
MNRIKNISVKNFKRFTDLTISDIPETSKLVLLIGSNGSGKSSLFDAFDYFSKKSNQENITKNELDYYKKNSELELSSHIEFSDNSTIKYLNQESHRESTQKNKFIGRSSNRIIPRLSNTFSLNDVPNDLDSPQSFIENDSRFNNDSYLFIQQINNELTSLLFEKKNIDTEKIFHEFIEPLNNSLLRIFGGNYQNTIQIADLISPSPYSVANIIFKKGESKINYDLLSHGEKQVVILLINFIVRKEYYEDAIIFIDEMDCHLNTLLQYNLLQEIVTRWIPDSSQLWTASHALGFIDYANKSKTASIIDFDLLNFDLKQELFPQSKDTLDVYEIAVPKATISSILKGYKLVVVENQNDQYFNMALGTDGYLFLPANNNREVFLTIKQDKEKYGLRDRDYLKQDEVESIKNEIPNLKILLFYAFENYLYHPKNILELDLKGFDAKVYVDDIIFQKNEKLLDIVAEINISRTHYIEFKEVIKNTENIKPIIEALKTDVFDVFYPFLNMKKHYNKKYLNQFTYSIADLSKTKWFKNEILSVLKQ